MLGTQGPANLTQELPVWGLCVTVPSARKALPGTPARHTLLGHPGLSPKGTSSGDLQSNGAPTPST